MKLFVTTEHRFARESDGSVFAASEGRSYEFWRRYLEVFDEVTVIARVRDEQTDNIPSAIATGKNVHFLGLPDFQGIGGLISRYPLLVRALNRGTGRNAAYLLRVPGVIGTTVARHLRQRGQVYGVEVVGDPAGVLSDESFRHPLRQVMRARAVENMKSVCEDAIAASYVTRHVLQGYYPPSGSAATAAYSSVELPEDRFVSQPRTFGHIDHERLPVRLVTVGTMAQRHKGMDTVLDAVGRLRRSGVLALLELVGDGKYRAELERQAEELGVSDSVRFLGMLPAWDSVATRLDAADLFVMGSRTEGLPRAMIEAMARALPCIGTQVGGIPELLPPDDLVSRDDPSALAERIRLVTSDPERMARMSRRNLDVAQEYRSDILQARRRAFYGELRGRTEAWLVAR